MRILQVLQKITNGFNRTATRESVQNQSVFVRDTPWMTSLIIKNLCRRTKERGKIKEVEMRHYSLLRRRQIKMETEAWEKMTEEYKELEREMYEKKLAPNLPYVEKLFLGWFEPLRDAIAKEQNKQRTTKHKAAFAPHIVALPADKIAVIVMHKMMGQDDRCVRVVQAAVQIGSAIEQEVRIHSFLERTNQREKIVAQTQEDLSKETSMLKERVIKLIKRKRLREVQKLVKDEEIKSWSRDAQAKLGCRLIVLLIETANVQPPVSQSADTPPDIRPVFRHMFKCVYKEPGSFGKRYGVIECDPLVVTGLDRTIKHMIIPYVPMLVPPKQWKRYDKGGYFFLPSYVLRTHGSRQQQDALKRVPPKQTPKVFEALDTLGNTKWRINKRVPSVAESIWSGGGNLAGLVDREDVPIPKVHSEDSSETKEWRWSVRKANKINQERHSLRCDTELKLLVARKMKDEEGFYYPHNIDLRGRAYPMHPHLNHLSSDLCRGVLEFCEGRPLGKSGLRWLKIHLANLYAGGVEKLSYDGRLSFVDNHLKDIFDSLDNPLTGDRRWLAAEDPFQCLAACINLSEALKSSSPHAVISHLPIHQDGSCNGLQHYAALGRDAFEADAVNLIAGEKPADVYSEIAASISNTEGQQKGERRQKIQNGRGSTTLGIPNSRRISTFTKDCTEAIDWRAPWDVLVQDQDNYPLCEAYASATILEFYQYIGKGYVDDDACPHIKELIARKRSRPPPKSSYSDLYDWQLLEDTGLTTKYIEYNSRFLKSCLHCHPAMIQVDIGSTFDKLKYNEIYYGPKTKDEILEGHTMVVVGYLGDLLIVQNSWGNYWGLYGYGYINVHTPEITMMTLINPPKNRVIKPRIRNDAILFDDDLRKQWEKYYNFPFN